MQAEISRRFYFTLVLKVCFVLLVILRTARCDQHLYIRYKQTENKFQVGEPLQQCIDKTSEICRPRKKESKQESTTYSKGEAKNSGPRCSR